MPNNIDKILAQPKDEKDREAEIVDNVITEETRGPKASAPESREDSDAFSESDIYKSARRVMKVIFEKYDKPEERREEIVKKVEPFFSYLDKEILPDHILDEIKIEIDAHVFIPDKKEFLEAMIKTLKPILDLKEKYPRKFEDAQAKAMNELGGLTEINRLLSYEKYKSTIQIHAPAGKTIDNKLGLYREGMRKLAEIVNKDPEVKQIETTSSLVAEHQGLFIRIGFKVEKVTEEFKREHFAGEEGEVKRASISREEFLNRFFKK